MSDIESSCESEWSDLADAYSHAEEALSASTATLQIIDQEELSKDIKADERVQGESPVQMPGSHSDISPINSEVEEMKQEIEKLKVQTELAQLRADKAEADARTAIAKAEQAQLDRVQPAGSEKAKSGSYEELVKEVDAIMARNPFGWKLNEYLVHGYSYKEIHPAWLHMLLHWCDLDPQLHQLAKSDVEEANHQLSHLVACRIIGHLRWDSFRGQIICKATSKFYLFDLICEVALQYKFDHADYADQLNKLADKQQFSSKKTEVRDFLHIETPETQ